MPQTCELTAVETDARLVVSPWTGRVGYVDADIEWDAIDWDVFDGVDGIEIQQSQGWQLDDAAEKAFRSTCFVDDPPDAIPLINDNIHFPSLWFCKYSPNDKCYLRSEDCCAAKVWEWDQATTHETDAEHGAEHGAFEEFQAWKAKETDRIDQEHYRMEKINNKKQVDPVEDDISDGFDKRYWKIKTPFCIYDLTKDIPLAHSHLNQFYAISKKHRIKNQEDEDPKKKDNLYKKWLRNTSNNADGIDFRPDKPPYEAFTEPDDKTGLNNRIFNIFSGFIDPNPSGDCQLFLDFVREVIAMDSESYYIWLLNWMSRIIQDPCDRIHSYALALQSIPGCGKTFFFNCYGHLLGSCYIKIADMENILGFNSLICGKVLVYCEEAIYTASQRESNRLKDIINGDKIEINQKHIAQFHVKNYITIGSGTNSDISAPVELGDRRWVCLKLNESRKEDHRYFQAIQEQLDHGGYGALMYYLKNYKLDYSILDDRPITTLHKENQKAWLYKNKPIYGFLQKLLDEYHGGARNLLSDIQDGYIPSGWFNAQYTEFLARNRERAVDSRCIIPMLEEILNRKDISARHYFKEKAPDGKEVSVQRHAYLIGTIEEIENAMNIGIKSDDIPF